MTPAEVLSLMKEKEVKFVDLRFTDTRGKEQHVSVPTRVVDEDFFTDGKMFDGSSIAGWKGINESDMILMPDAATRGDRSVLRGDAHCILRCDVIEPSTMQGYERDPRSLGQARGGLSQVDRHRRRRSVRPGERVLHLRLPCAWASGMSGSFYDDRFRGSARGAPGTGIRRAATQGHRPGVKGGYFPVPPVDSSAGHPLGDVPGARGAWPAGRGAPPRSGDRRPGRDQRLRQHA